MLNLVMIRSTSKNRDNDWQDDSSDDDSEHDLEEGFDSDEEPTIPCPWCRRDILEDCDRCPHCEQYLSSEDAPLPRKPLWVTAGALLCLYAVYRWLF
ncbi:MAG: zinc ribbon domain-containing protein [Planctomycetia bacterium]|nr:zinc ribbon domain-containing protein [Planctomycetia bacterium]RLT13230.1 MAG: zinc ribbon domain-containing protein [Planctomycetota bacterium]